MRFCCCEDYLNILIRSTPNIYHSIIMRIGSRSWKKIKNKKCTYFLKHNRVNKLLIIVTIARKWVSGIYCAFQTHPNILHQLIKRNYYVSFNFKQIKCFFFALMTWHDKHIWDRARCDAHSDIFASSVN